MQNEAQQMASQQIVQNELEPDERMLWSDRPDPKRVMTATLVVWLFAVPWTAFALFWMFGDFKSGNLAFTLFGTPFVLIGLAMLSSPFWAYRKALVTVYGITDRRVLIIYNGKTRTVDSYTSHDLSQISRKERVDGSGDLVFAKVVTPGSDGPTTQKIEFTGISQVRSVENLLRDTLQK